MYLTAVELVAEVSHAEMAGELMSVFKIQSQTTAGTHVTSYRNLAGFTQGKESGGPQVVLALQELLDTWPGPGVVVTMTALREPTWLNAHRVVKEAVFRGMKERLEAGERGKHGSVNLFGNAAAFVAYVLRVQSFLVKEGLLMREDVVGRDPKQMEGAGIAHTVDGPAGEVAGQDGGWQHRPVNFRTAGAGRGSFRGLAKNSDGMI